MIKPSFPQLLIESTSGLLCTGVNLNVFQVKLLLPVDDVPSIGSSS